MGERTRNGLLGALAVALVGAAVAWFLHTHERIEKDIALPPRGEAGYNPLYALRKTLEVDQVAVRSRQRLDLRAQRLQPGDTLLLLEDPRGIVPADARRLLEWVEQGGHLILRTPPQSAGSAPAPMLEQLGISVRGSARCEALQVQGEEPHVEFCHGRRFDLGALQPELAWGDLSNGHVFARVARGRGRVDVLADMDFLHNGGTGEMFDIAVEPSAQAGGLRDGAHRALARQLLAPNYGRGTVHLVYATQMPSLLRMVLTRGWPVWLPLALALLAWLWSRAQRFGPLRPAPAAERRSLLEHVRASGEHLSRYNKRPLLYDAVRRAFLARLRRRDPMAASLAGEAQVQAIAERAGVPVEHVRRALQAPSSHDKPGFRERISTLIDLRRHL